METTFFGKAGRPQWGKIAQRQHHLLTLDLLTISEFYFCLAIGSNSRPYGNLLMPVYPHSVGRFPQNALHTVIYILPIHLPRAKSFFVGR
jgi:hypothetical protein